MDDLAAWRWIVMFGKNSASYKLALADQLLHHASQGNDRIDMDELAQNFASAYQPRVEAGKPQQGTPGRFTVVERAILQGDLDDNVTQVREQALRKMVLQKFHNMDGGVESPRFFLDPGAGNHLQLTDRLLNLTNTDTLRSEATSRWDLLEHAFSDPNPETIRANELLSSLETRRGRTTLTHLIPGLSGFQDNLCFYCGGPLDSIHADHFLPHANIGHNQVWNLVLADHSCNLNKSDNLPTPKMVERLIDRNEALIRSMNPLRNTVIEDLGQTPAARKASTLEQYQFCKELNPRIWGGGSEDVETMIQQWRHYVQAHRV